MLVNSKIYISVKNHQFVLKIISVATLSLFSSAAVWAEDTETQTLQDVQITAQNRSTRTENKDNLTTSAMRTTTGLALSPKETPQSVSAITNSLLENRGISRMEDALKTSTGINVIRDSGRWRFQSRGFYIDQMEVDGIATTVAGSSGNPYRDAQSLTDLAIYDHIEVVRGATGLTQANGEPGGTVNAVRKKPTAKTQIQGDLSVNRFGNARATFDVSGSLNTAKTLRGRFIAVGERINGDKKDDEGSNVLLYGVTEADWGENTKLTTGLMYQRQATTPDYFGVPMAVGGGDAGFSRDTYLGYDWTRDVSKKYNVFIELEHYFNDDWKASAKIDNTYSQSDKRLGAIYNSSTSYAGLPENGTLATQNFQHYLPSNHQLGIQFNLNGKYELFGQKHDLFTGYSYSRETSDTTWQRIRNSLAYNPRTFSGSEQAEPNWNAYNDRTFYRSHITSHAINFGTRFNIGANWHILAGTRYTKWKSSGVTDYDWWNNKPDSDADEYSHRSKNRFVPYFGITYDLTPNQSIYASYTNIFKPSSTQDINGNYLKPVTGTNYEIGWKGEWLNRHLNTAVALFNIDQKNRAAQVYDTTHQKWVSENIGRVRSRGLDWEISGRLNDNWQIFAGYTLNNSKYLIGENGRNSVSPYLKGMNFSRHTPKHMLRLYTSYVLPFDNRKWKVGGGMSLQSKTSSLGYVKQGGYALWNADIHYQPNEHINISLIGSNLFNKRYFENMKTRYNGINNFLGEGRNVTLKVDWKF